MSRTGDVIRNKNRIEKKIKQRRKEEINSLRQKTIFKAKLADALQHVEVILNDSNVEAVKITVPDKQLAMFTACIYTEDMVGFDVEQVDGVANEFYLRKKVIAF